MVRLAWTVYVTRVGLIGATTLFIIVKGKLKGKVHTIQLVQMCYCRLNIAGQLWEEKAEPKKMRPKKTYEGRWVSARLFLRSASH